jgi:hypothetical protein
MRKVCVFFSKLKTVKTALHNSMSDHRLQNLILLNNERDITDNVDLRPIGLEMVHEDQPTNKFVTFIMPAMAFLLRFMETFVNINICCRKYSPIVALL